VIVIDTSALCAVLWAEPEAAALTQRVAASGAVLISAGTRLEAYVVCLRTRSPAQADMMEALVARLGLITVPFDDALLAASREGYARYGRGNGAGGRLNFGDCFAYALAKSRSLPLLFKGDDFRSTDVRAAL
jgi:ribonuclease VapC